MSLLANDPQQTAENSSTKEQMQVDSELGDPNRQKIMVLDVIQVTEAHQMPTMPGSILRPAADTLQANGPKISIAPPQPQLQRRGVEINLNECADDQQLPVQGAKKLRNRGSSDFPLR